MNIGADGLKTGFTKEAGYGLVGSAVQNGLRLIVVVNGCKTAKERADEAKQAARMGLPQLRVADRCSPRARRSARPRSMAARKGTCRCQATRPVRLHGAARRRARRSSAQHRLYRPGAGAGREGPADRRR